uniref:Uncharacterized protein n=1 Tax=Nelumbo nucifera TaxID=4432 RepID=A0A822Z234_NELNU|nr:TPA_asm: hypothetical protein HUJ06_013405 [Nelumbo nucifera]
MLCKDDDRNGIGKKTGGPISKFLNSTVTIQFCRGRKLQNKQIGSHKLHP